MHFYQYNLLFILVKQISINIENVTYMLLYRINSENTLIIKLLFFPLLRLYFTYMPEIRHKNNIFLKK